MVAVEPPKLQVTTVVLAVAVQDTAKLQVVQAHQVKVTMVVKVTLLTTHGTLLVVAVEQAVLVECPQQAQVYVQVTVAQVYNTHQSAHSTSVAAVAVEPTQVQAQAAVTVASVVAVAVEPT